MLVMTYPKGDFKKFFLPVYIIWAVVNPTLLLLPESYYGILISFSADKLIRIISFYLMFGLIWPLSIIVYPAFLSSPSIKENPFYVALTYFAIIGPILSFIGQAARHKKYVEKRLNKKMSVEDYLWDFI